MKHLICPKTGRRVIGEMITIQPTPRGQTVWWRCSACDRWHVTELPSEQNGHGLPMTDDTSEPPEE